ncbi:peptide/nickel transport system substrate-binding protein [Labedella gwakjiensis]|uniref:ABC transporter substrate-binding protein n=1 Tax=Labedella gwakjiensis TaxID=390269 RepID=A0A2P8GUX1_9MICO|nr:ABC transporter substrate-binding protein [Labedella gwakjiensis]PSL37767.1 peptide/nickel transport system substrate-binding protein [Labedella gwakjiensis]RUQ87649.1 ABC transporter substrate-binding protein [Labedella gwakjiensis]
MQHTPRRSRRRLGIAAGTLVAALALVGCAGGGSGSDDAEQELIIGSQMASLPSLDTGAITLAGYEGQRLIGNLVYEGLTKRDVSDPNAAAGVGPALAESWEISEDGLTYTFSLQQGVTFHDGTDFDADAVVYNINRYTDENDPHYDAAVGTYYAVLNYVDSVEAIDDSTVAFTLTEPFAFFLADLYNVYFASPTSLDEDGNEGQAKNPVGTGPFVFDELTENQSISFTRNDDYWGDAAELDRITVELIPDPAARTAALRSGRVDWIEAAQPDDLASLEDAGFVATGNAFDWEWSWQLFTDVAPFDDIRVRQAMNYAIDREAIADDLLHGTAVPAYQFFAEASLYYDEADNIYSYDPDKAEALLAEAGYADGLDITVGYITAGSGSMQAKAMNEALQAQLSEVGINVTLDPVDFSGMYAALGEGNTGWNAANQAFSLEQPSSWSWSMLCGTNYFGYCNEEFDALHAEALVTSDDEERAALLTEAGHLQTEDAGWMYVVNDTAPRAMASYVKGFEQPKSWWIDFTGVSIEK